MSIRGIYKDGKKIEENIQNEGINEYLQGEVDINGLSDQFKKEINQMGSVSEIHNFL